MEIEVGEGKHNVFPGNTFSSKDLPSSKEVGVEGIEESTSKVSQWSVSHSFRAKIVPFSRATDALKSLEQDFVNWKEDERIQLKQVLEDLEQSLTQLKARL